MDNKQLMILGAVGVGLWLILGKKEEAAGGPGTQNPSALNLAPLLAQAQTAGKHPSLMTVDQWNYLYSQVRGVPGPAFEDLGVDWPREKNLSLAEYLAVTSGKGVSGLGRYNPTLSQVFLGAPKKVFYVSR